VSRALPATVFADGRTGRGRVWPHGPRAAFPRRVGVKRRRPRQGRGQRQRRAGPQGPRPSPGTQLVPAQCMPTQGRTQATRLASGREPSLSMAVSLTRRRSLPIHAAPPPSTPPCSWCPWTTTLGSGHPTRPLLACCAGQRGPQTMHLCCRTCLPTRWHTAHKSHCSWATSVNSGPWTAAGTVIGVCITVAPQCMHKALWLPTHSPMQFRSRGARLFAPRAADCSCAAAPSILTSGHSHTATWLRERTPPLAGLASPLSPARACQPPGSSGPPRASPKTPGRAHGSCQSGVAPARPHLNAQRRRMDPSAHGQRHEPHTSSEWTLCKQTCTAVCAFHTSNERRGERGGGGGKRHNCTGSIRPVGAQRAADLQSLLVRRNCARHVPCFVRCLSTTAGFVRGRVPVGRLQHRHGK
jgi:hypothetical protein